MFFIVKKRTLFAYLSILVTLIVGACVATAHFGDRTKLPTVIIDAGHGEPDGGCVGVLGTIEQEINLSVARKLAETLEAKNISTIMTRDSSLGLWSEKSTSIREKKLEDMKKRLEIIKKSDADLFISIHMNSYPTKSASGLRVFYDKNHSEIKVLGEKIQSRMADVTGAKISSVTPASATLYLLKDAPIPSILIECGFLSNPEEEKKLMQSEYRSRLAWAIGDAIEKYFLENKIN